MKGDELMVDTGVAVPAAGLATAANEPARKTRRKRRFIFGMPRAVALILLCALFVYPLVWMVLGAFKTQSTFFANLWGLPSNWDFQNFFDAWSVGNIGRYLLNSVIVTGFSVLLVLVLSLPLSFALARTRFIGGKVIFGLFIITLFMPLQLLIIPMYELEANLGIINTYWGLILPYAAGALPFSVVFATSFFQGLPAELDEAARLDGCNLGQIFVWICLPLSRPAIATIVILTFLNTWNEFILALTLTQSDSVRTIPVGLLNFSQQMGQTNYPQLFAALTMATTPIFVVFLLTQKQFISGLVEGAVK
ncbi:carbohydrate ABC transporter permease [Nocardia sp. NBC_00403]|uniref:carbohydrate ABC transporter permease n=1 Tax=Nocardia sp. NBC_00403 TaxID=2975990 RepID=UPI002E216771